MSILQDLDPKYAKIHSQSSLAKWKSIAWIFSLLLVFVGASWLVYTLQNGKETRQDKLTAITAQDQDSTKSTAAQTNDIKAPQNASSNEAGSSLVTSKTGSAVIQETKEAAPEKSEKNLEASPLPSAAAEPKKLATSDHASKPIAREETGQHKPRKAKDYTTEQKQPNKAHADKNSQPGTKKAAERDIDIITAIVR